MKQLIIVLYCVTLLFVTLNFKILVQYFKVVAQWKDTDVTG